MGAFRRATGPDDGEGSPGPAAGCETKKEVISMMSRTHLAVGVATALALTRPDTPQAWMLAVAGGAVCDIDLADSDRDRDARLGQVIPVGIAVACLLADALFRLGVRQDILAGDPVCLAGGAVLYLVLCWLGYRSGHRTFTHSVTALALFSLAVWLVYPLLMPPFAAAFASHLVLDLLNKKGMRILYPLPISPSLGLCYAGGAVNKLLYRLGSIAALLLTGLSVWHWLH